MQSTQTWQLEEEIKIVKRKLLIQIERNEQAPNNWNELRIVNVYTWIMTNYLIDSEIKFRPINRVFSKRNFMVSSQLFTAWYLILTNENWYSEKHIWVRTIFKNYPVCFSKRNILYHLFKPNFKKSYFINLRKMLIELCYSNSS